MAFIKRLGWYLVGVSVGLVFLSIIIKKKSGEDGINFCYLPNCRVLKDFRSKKLNYASQLANTERDSTYFSMVFKDGDINFDKSNTKTEPCKTYFVNYKNQEIELQNCKDEIVITNVVDKN